MSSTASSSLVKALVWFWIIDETYGLILELSVWTREDGPKPSGGDR